ncbi:MAG: ABC transporter permease, partial [Acidimicrobiia bacterium]
MRAMPRNIDMMVFATAQPIMFVLLFRYVFGGSISVPGFSYNQYLMPGIFAQTVVFGSVYTSIGLAEDMQKGFIDRLRSLPISQGAVLVGRTISDTLRNVIT